MKLDSARVVGPQEDCVQCGESKAAVKESQRRGGQHQLYCAIVDYWGECSADWDRHKFQWTERDRAAAELAGAYWAAESAKWEAEEAAAAV